MSQEQVFGLFWIVKVLAWGFILKSSFRWGLPRKYPLVFLYIYSSIVMDIMGAFSALWLETSTSYAIYYVTMSFWRLALAAAVLLYIYALLGGLRWKADWHLIAVPAIVFGVGLFDPRPMSVHFRLLDAGYVSLCYIAVVTLHRSLRTRDVALGWNLKMALLALTVPAALYSFVLVAFSLGQGLSREDTNLWIRGIALSLWIILAIGMSEYSPPLFFTDILQRGASTVKRADISEARF